MLPLKKVPMRFLVHHGFFWKGESQEIVGMKYKRIKALLEKRHQPLCLSPAIGRSSAAGQ